MFGPPRYREPAPPRNVWADKTKALLDDAFKRREEFLKKIDSEIAATKAACNHTRPDGTSTLEELFDHEYDTHYMRCTACQQRP